MLVDKNYVKIKSVIVQVILVCCNSSSMYLLLLTNDFVVIVLSVILVKRKSDYNSMYKKIYYEFKHVETSKIDWKITLDDP